MKTSTLLLTLVLPALLIACGPPKRTLLAGYCPSVIIAATAETYPDDGRGFTASIDDVDADCKGFTNSAVLYNEFTLSGNVVAGAGTAAGRVQLPIFVGLQRPDGSFAAQFERMARFKLPAAGMSGSFTVVVDDFYFDIAAGKKTYDYRFVVGFRLAADQLAANQTARQRALGLIRDE